MLLIFTNNPRLSSIEIPSNIIVSYSKWIEIIKVYFNKKLQIGINEPPESASDDWISASIYLLKGNNRNTRKRCQLCLKLTIKTPIWRCWRYMRICQLWACFTLFYSVFIVNFEHVSHLFLLFLSLTLNQQMFAG